MATMNDPLFLKELSEYHEGHETDKIFGTHGGNKVEATALCKFMLKFIQPYVRSDRVACDIGSGGGRMLQYLTGFKTIYAVDYHEEMHTEMLRFFDHPYIVPILTNGIDFPNMGFS